MNSNRNDTALMQCLQANGIKQTWLAKKVGVTAPALNLLARGKTVPTLRTAQRIARVLHSTVDDLWPLDDSDLQGQ